jgi:hypothetical protein
VNISNSKVALASRTHLAPPEGNREDWPLFKKTRAGGFEVVVSVIERITSYSVVD